MSKVNPVVHGRMYKVSDGGSIKGVKFNKNGTVQVLVVPKTKRNPRKKKRNKAKAKRNCRISKRNASIRKLKKEWAGYGRDWRRSQIRVTKARAKAKKKNRKKRKNASVRYHVYLGTKPLRSFGSFKLAKAFAQREARRHGEKTTVYSTLGRLDPHIGDSDGRLYVQNRKGKAIWRNRKRSSVKRLARR